MKTSLVPLALALAALCAAPGLAYGVLEPLNEPGTLLRKSVADPAYAAADGALVGAGDAPLSRRIDHRDENATWQVYDDRNRNGKYDGEAEAYVIDGTWLPNATFRHARIDGNATDHVLVTLYGAGLRFRVCTDQAQDGLDQRARGLRCNGDVDGDGTGDVEELPEMRNPLRPNHPSRPDNILSLP